MCFRLCYKKGRNILPDVTNMENIENMENNHDLINNKPNIPRLDITESSLYKRRIGIKDQNIGIERHKFVHTILL